LATFAASSIVAAPPNSLAVLLAGSKQGEVC
jgi:hypothetical protein